MIGKGDNNKVGFEPRPDLTPEVKKDSPELGIKQIPAPTTEASLPKLTSLPARDIQPLDVKVESTRWALQKMQKWGITLGRNMSGKKFELRLKPSEIQNYIALQESIAKLIPEEQNRPTIDLCIQKSTRAPKRTLGVIGGVGPVSDAHIMEKTLLELQKRGGQLRDVRIQVLSCPPPRNLFHKASHGLGYLSRLKEFVGRDHDHIVLASNTAHCNIRKFQSEGILSAGGRVVNCVEGIAEKIQTENPDSVLIFGTTEAFKKELYPKALQKAGIPPLVPADQHQAMLQQQINKVKRSVTDRDQVAQDICRIIIESHRLALQQGKTPSHILLSCTELPLALGAKRINNLEELLGVRIIDTEQELSEQFAQLLLDS